MPETVTCNLCGADDAKLLYRSADYRFWTNNIEWNVVRCRCCGLGYLNPRPTVVEITNYYPRVYFDDAMRPRERYERQARYVHGDSGSLLDIGTARGEFLEVMRKRGWQVEGIEGSDAAPNPYGLPIHKLRFPDECNLAPGTFDVVTGWAVFEHLHDPAAAFHVVSELLAPKGKLIIQVPNLASVFGRWSRMEDVPRHLYFFSPATLRQYGAMTGLRLRRVEHTTGFYGGSGRGVLRLALVRALGGSTADFFRVIQASRRERFRRWPLLAPAWQAVAAAERVILPDWGTRFAQVSGQIVAVFEKR